MQPDCDRVATGLPHAAVMKPKTDPKIERLRNVPGLAGTSDRELARLLPYVDDAELPAGYVLMEEGKPGREAFVIIDGEVEVAVHDQVLARLGPGEVIGEMSLLDHSPRSATVVASTPMRVLVLDPVGFRSILREPTVATGLATGLAKRLRDLEGGPTYERDSAR